MAGGSWTNEYAHLQSIGRLHRTHTICVRLFNQSRLFIQIYRPWYLEYCRNRRRPLCVMSRNTQASDAENPYRTSIVASARRISFQWKPGIPQGKAEQYTQSPISARSFKPLRDGEHHVRRKILEARGHGFHFGEERNISYPSCIGKRFGLPRCSRSHAFNHQLA